VESETQAGAATGSSLPEGMFEQVPALPVTLQALQLSVQSVLQQTPSAQWPVAQSVNVPQPWPRLALQT
jgi:hypothetical protein